MKKFTQILIYLIVLGIPLAAKAGDDRTPVTEVIATSNYAEIISYGRAVTIPTVTVAKGSIATIPVSMINWQKKNADGSWTFYKDSEHPTFEEGNYRLTFQVRIDDANYVLTNPYRLTVNGVKWTTGDVYDYTTHCFSQAYSPEITVKEGALQFNNSSGFNIPESAVGQPIKSYSVASGVSGGTEPYTFSNVSGPDWITVSADGTVSGTPSVMGNNSKLMVRVTDADSATAEITITVGRTAWIPVTEVVATSDYTDIIGYGKAVKIPTFTTPDDSHAIISTIDWQKKLGDDDWYTYNTSYSPHPTFEEGTYRVRVRVYADLDNHYAVGNSLTFTVNGTAWETFSPEEPTANNFGTAFSPEITVANDTRTLISDVAASSNYTEIIGFGKPVTTPTFTMADGSIASVAACYWTKKQGENMEDWKYYDDPSEEATFEEGTYLLMAQVLVNAPGYVLANPWTFTVNGTEWTTNTAQDETTYSWGAAMSKDIKVVAPAGIENISTDGPGASAPVYNLQGIKMQGSLETLPASLYIIGGKKVIKK